MNFCVHTCVYTFTRLLPFPRGLLKVAEVSSRFEDIRTFLGAVTKLGFKVIYKVRVPNRSAPVFVLPWIMMFKKEAVTTEVDILLFQDKTPGGSEKFSKQGKRMERCGCGEDFVAYWCFLLLGPDQQPLLLV